MQNLQERALKASEAFLARRGYEQPRKTALVRLAARPGRSERRALAQVAKLAARAPAEDAAATTIMSKTQKAMRSTMEN